MARDYKDHVQGRYYGLERTLTVILFLIFTLAIATGILSFIRLNNVIHSVDTSVRPDRSLILAKDIFSYLTAAENSVKSYSLTQREEDMVSFYSLTETMSARMRELKDISMDDP
jgi:CHASE3 domain sensor protein